MPPPYYFKDLEFKSKEDLYNLKKLKTLKELAFEFNNRTTYNNKILNVNKRFNLENFKEMCDILWEKWGGDGYHFETKEYNIKDILNMYEYEEGTPPGSPPKRRFDTLTPTPTPNKLFFNFEDTNIEINLTECTEKVFTNDNNFGPKELLNLVNTDDFCIKIANSLKELYKEKETKYKIIQNHTISESPIIKATFVTKTKTLSKLASEKYNEFVDPESKIEFVRRQLIKAITDENLGIVSINQDNLRHQFCKQIFILSKGCQPFINTFINIVFSGNQTVELAKKYAYIFENIGVLLTGKVIVISPKDIVEQTDIKSISVLMKGLENIIFIDRIISNVNCFEPIAKIIHFLNKYTGMSIMMISGFQKEIDKYFFTDIYSNNDLLNIFLSEVNKKLKKDIITKEIALYIYTIILNISNQNKQIFNNKDDMINLSIIFLNLYYNDKWNAKETDNILMINQTFNEFLINKGYNLEIN
jgi:hypothetical protein